MGHAVADDVLSDGREWPAEGGNLSRRVKWRRRFEGSMAEAWRPIDASTTREHS